MFTEEYIVAEEYIVTAGCSGASLIQSLASGFLTLLSTGCLPKANLSLSPF